MKMTDLKREHFKNGASFNQADFDAYIAASDKYAKSFGIKSLSCMAGGILLSFLFSSAGGFAGNMMAVAAIFAGMILGAVLNAPALKTVNNAAKKLGITKADVSEATRNLKSGTTAWQGEPGTVAAHEEAQATPQPMEAPAAKQRNFARATKLLWATVAIWLVGTFLFLIPLDGLILSLGVLFNLAYAVLAAGIYLLCFAQEKQRKAGVLGVMMSFVMQAVLGFSLIYVYSDRMADPVMAQLVPTIVRALLCTGVTVVGALFGKRGNHVNVAARVGFFAAGALLVYGVVNGIVISGNAVTFLDALFDGVIFAGLYFLTDSLCSMKKPALQLHGLGLGWCWFATIGAGAAVVLNIVQSINAGLGLDVFQIILPFFMLAGYIMLLCKRKSGLYFILYGAAIVMAAALLSALEGLVYQSTQPVQLVSAVLALLNPLFAWLAVRAGTAEAPASSAESQSKASPSSVLYMKEPASPASGNSQKQTSILEKYRAGLSYLDGCGTFDEAKFREFNRITGNRFSEADIQTQLCNAQKMIKGMEEVKSVLRSSMAEGISTFEKLEQSGIDLSKYNL